MKFLCVECDEQMLFDEREVPGDGTLMAAFRCPSCQRRIAMLTNPMETQLVSSLGVKIGEETVPGAEPMEVLSQFLDTEAAPTRAPGPVWDEAAQARLSAVPSFVRGMVKRIYGDYAKERGIEVITPDVMSKARADLGLEGM